MGLARAHRVTYVGELGWELYVSSDQAAHVFETLVEAGAALGLRLCGLHAMDSCRIEKAYRHFGHDITDEDHVLEAGLGFAVKTGKGDFIGRDAVLRKREAGPHPPAPPVPAARPRAAALSTASRSSATAAIVGHLTSGNYGHALGAAIGLGYVPCQAGETAEDLLASAYAIEVAGRSVQAEASLVPLYDPRSERVKELSKTWPPAPSECLPSTLVIAEAIPTDSRQPLSRLGDNKPPPTPIVKLPPVQPPDDHTERVFPPPVRRRPADAEAMAERLPLARQPSLLTGTQPRRDAGVRENEGRLFSVGLAGC